MFNIQYFASTSYMMSETSLPVTPENIEFAKKIFLKITAAAEQTFIML